MRIQGPLLLALILAGCSLAPRYHPPSSSGPCCWKEEVPACAIDMPECDDWWVIFNDPCLNELEEIALEQNPTLEIAYQRIAQAESIANKSFSRFFPYVTLNPFLVNLDSLYSPSTFGVPIPDIRAHVQEYSVPAVASYELDLFGKIRNGYFADKAMSDAHAFAYETVKLTLTTDVALTYFRIRSLDAQNEVLKETIKSREADIEIVTARYNAGLVNEVDVTRAKTQLATAQAQLSRGLLERAKDENLLATFLGYYASEYSICVSPLTTLPPAVAPNLPAELLKGRPDVKEAERKMAAQNALIGVARSQYFPSLSLTGALGYASPTVSQLFEWQSRLWFWAVDAVQVLFDAGRTEAVNREVESQFLQALSEYIKTVLTAFQEAENALAAEKYTEEQFESYQAAVASAKDTKEITHERYVKGLFNYLEVEDANRSLLHNRLLMERTRFERYQASIQLIKALGG